MTNESKKTKNLFKPVSIIWALIIILSIVLYKDVAFTGTLLALTIASFMQNMAFTWVSRSRQSGDADYHRYAAWCSNAVWLLAQTFIAANIYTPITNMVQQNSLDIQEISKIFFTFLIYAISTTEGSVLMMKALLGKIKLPFVGKYLIEKGKRQVGKR